MEDTKIGRLFGRLFYHAISYGIAEQNPTPLFTRPVGDRTYDGQVLSRVLDLPLHKTGLQYDTVMFSPGERKWYLKQSA